jgi:hypothetical protein
VHEAKHWQAGLIWHFTDLAPTKRHELYGRKF